MAKKGEISGNMNLEKYRNISRKSTGIPPKCFSTVSYPQYLITFFLIVHFININTLDIWCVFFMPLFLLFGFLKSALLIKCD